MQYAFETTLKYLEIILRSGFEVLYKVKKLFISLYLQEMSVENTIMG